jgi:hypothetical protein
MTAVSAPCRVHVASASVLIFRHDPQRRAWVVANCPGDPDVGIEPAGGLESGGALYLEGRFIAPERATRARCSKRANCWLRSTGGSRRGLTRVKKEAKVLLEELGA